MVDEFIRSLLFEKRRPVFKRVADMSWARSTAFRPRYDSIPYDVMFRWCSSNFIFSVLENSSAGEWNYNSDGIDDDQVKREIQMQGVLGKCKSSTFHVLVQERVASECERRRKEFLPGLGLLWDC